ncbi:hypothetical protein HDF11_004446 [Tunturiibacter psychrotolerans]
MPGLGLDLIFDLGLDSIFGLSLGGRSGCVEWF